MQSIDMNALQKVTENLSTDELILDVRTREEFAEGHIPGARNIPHDEVGQHADELRKYKKIYIHCRSGGRAQNAWFELAQKGITQLVCVAGSGMPDWVAAGFPVQKG